MNVRKCAKMAERTGSKRVVKGDCRSFEKSKILKYEV